MSKCSQGGEEKKMLTSAPPLSEMIELALQSSRPTCLRVFQFLDPCYGCNRSQKHSPVPAYTQGRTICGSLGLGWHDHHPRLKRLYMTDELGMGYQNRRVLNREILAGRLTFRDGFRQMLESVHHPFDECKEILKKNIPLDPGFRDFWFWCKSKGIPVVIVSSGMEPLIRAVLTNSIGEKEASEIEIISNSVKLEDGGKKWDIQYRHPESGFGHDKSQAILPYRDLPHRPTLFFLGDGVSDMSAAAHADVLFVKVNQQGDNDLATYCRAQGIKHVEIHGFSEALTVVQDVVEGRRTVDDVLQKGK